MDDGIEVDDDVIEEDVLRPLPRRKSFGPLPDLRFEQSYLRSIEHAESNWGVAAITLRDQVFGYFILFHVAIAIARHVCTKSSAIQRERGMLSSDAGSATASPRNDLVSPPIRLATLEPRDAIEWTDRGCQG